MKQCGTCGNTYTDASLLYCLSDGSPLTEIGAEEQTVLRTGLPSGADGGALRVDIPQTIAGPVNDASKPAGDPGSKSFLKIVVGIVVLGILLVAALGVAGLVYYNSTRASGPVANANLITANSNKNASPTPAATTDQTEELREQIANLERRLNDQRASNRTIEIPSTIPMPKTVTTAHVNSPGDGFLALRTLPSSEMGDRLAKIPHGAAVSIGACGPVVRPVSRAGRWCQASYGGYSGWVFDAYLSY